MKAPLLLGNDVRTMSAPALGVVMNKDALNISQDALGIQARRLFGMSIENIPYRVYGAKEQAAIAKLFRNTAANGVVELTRA